LTGALVASFCSALTSTAAAQRFEQIPAAALTKIAVGNQSVVGINEFKQVFAYKPGFNSFQLIPGQLNSIAVGGGTLVQPDEVWGLNAAQQVFRLDSNGSFQQIPGLLTQIAVGPGYETCHPAEVWGLNSFSDVFRYDFCSGQFHLAASGLLSKISVGEREVWGLNAAGAVFHWNFNTFVFENVPGVLSQISAGPAGAVWGVNTAGKIFRLSRDKEGGKFLEIPGQLAIVSVGGNGVWGLNFQEDIFHFDESAQQFVQVTGQLDSLTVGNGGGVWGLSAGQGVFVFKTE
jgi:hypothetical protein